MTRVLDVSTPPRAPRNPWLTVLLFCVLNGDARLRCVQKHRKKIHASVSQIARGGKTVSSFFCTKGNLAPRGQVATFDSFPPRPLMIDVSIGRMSPQFPILLRRSVAWFFIHTNERKTRGARCQCCFEMTFYASSYVLCGASVLFVIVPQASITNQDAEHHHRQPRVARSPSWERYVQNSGRSC